MFKLVILNVITNLLSRLRLAIKFDKDKIIFLIYSRPIRYTIL